MTPVVLGIFNPLFIPQHNPSVEVEKIGLYLSHLVPEILGPKVGLFLSPNGTI